METVSPFNLTLKVALSGVLEFGASLMPKSRKKKAGGRYATDLLLQLPALLTRFRRISERSLDQTWLIKA